MSVSPASRPGARLMTLQAGRGPGYHDHQPDLGQPLLGPRSQSRDPQATQTLCTARQRFHPNPLGYTTPSSGTLEPRDSLMRPPRTHREVGSSPGDHLQPPPSSTCCRPRPQEQGPTAWGFRWYPAHATGDRVGAEGESEGSLDPGRSLQQCRTHPSAGQDPLCQGV